MLLVRFIFFALSANVGFITMNNPELIAKANGQTLCAYSNSIYTLIYDTKSKYCHCSRTFNKAYN
ncbi:hypothetical protein FDP61_15100 [Enterobacter ludwigii]|nr:hypothetical protein A3UG_07855 [Enterobacter cloacae subsp. dissolvens SDM]MRI50658.1 hypothetical protein [Enterobacter ludwigii]